MAPTPDTSNSPHGILFPLKKPDHYDFFKQAYSCFWTPDEVDMTQDVKDFAKLSKPEQYFINMVLAFFLRSDVMVNENIDTNFDTQNESLETKFFYDFQVMMENFHTITYQQQALALTPDPDERARLFNALDTIPCVKRKGDWYKKWIADPSATKQQHLIVNAAVEGIFFSSSFCALFWLKNRGIMPGLTFANELISRDEGLHRDFAAYRYRQSTDDERLPPEDALKIITDAVELEKEFARDALPVELIGMNSKSMCTYIEYVADNLLVNMGLSKHYNHHECPFDFMRSISIDGKTNFHERRVGEYSRFPGGTFSMTGDF